MSLSANTAALVSSCIPKTQSAGTPLVLNHLGDGFTLEHALVTGLIIVLRLCAAAG